MKTMTKSQKLVLGKNVLRSLSNQNLLVVVGGGGTHGCKLSHHNACA